MDLPGAIKHTAQEFLKKEKRMRKYRAKQKRKAKRNRERRRRSAGALARRRGALTRLGGLTRSRVR